jgi:threonine dehydratase
VAGIATAVSAAAPAARIYAVEPEQFDDTARSLASGTRQSNAPGAKTICDAIVTPTPGEMTFAINRRLLAGGLSASDAEVRRAIVYASRQLKLVVEPGGAVALAAVLAGKLDIAGKTVVVVLSGGNIDTALLSEILAAA